MMPEKFYKTWAEIDPTLQHGGIPDELAGEYVGPDLGDNPATQNRDLLYIFNCVRDAAAALSMMPGADVEGPPLKNHVEEVLRAFNWLMERTMDRTRVCSTRFFQWCHAIPPVEQFSLRPIKYPLRMPFMDEVVFFLLGAMVEFAESNANGYHSNIDPSCSERLMAPLLHIKGNIARDWFDQEVALEVTLAELNVMFEGVARPGPNIVPAGETQPSPPPDKVAEALSGIHLIQWYPGTEHWQIFGRKRAELYKPERIFQPEGATPATEDVAPETPVKPISPG